MARHHFPKTAVPKKPKIPAAKVKPVAKPSLPRKAIISIRDEKLEESASYSKWINPNAEKVWGGKIIVIAGYNTGCGKTTLCASIAGELSRRLNVFDPPALPPRDSRSRLSQSLLEEALVSVALLDSDPRASGGLYQWWDLSHPLSAATRFDKVSSERSATIAMAMSQAGLTVLVDTAAAPSLTTLALFEIADLVLIPQQSDAVCVESVQLVMDDCRESGRALCAAVLIGKSSEHDALYAREMLAKKGVKVLKSELARRPAFCSLPMWTFFCARENESLGFEEARADIEKLVNEIHRLFRRR